MLSVTDSDARRPLSWDQRLLQHAARPRGSLRPEYQEL